MSRREESKFRERRSRDLIPRIALSSKLLLFSVSQEEGLILLFEMTMQKRIRALTF